MATLLRRVGMEVRSIYQCYPKKKHERVQDPTWIELCGRKGWVAISGDKRLEKNVENVAAIVRHKVKVFILSDTNSLPEEWASAVIVGQEKMTSVINKNEGPFFSTIQRQSRAHVSHARFPKKEEEVNNGKTTEIAGAVEDSVGLQADATGSVGNSARATEEGKEETA